MCDDRCWSAIGSTCHCECRGLFHGHGGFGQFYGYFKRAAGTASGRIATGTMVDTAAVSFPPLGTGVAAYRAQARIRRGLQSFIQTYLKTHDRSLALRSLAREVLGHDIKDFQDMTVESTVRILWTSMRNRYGIPENRVRDEAIVSGLSNSISALTGS